GPDVLPHTRPTTALERKFSMQFCAAAALAEGRVDLRSFEDGEVRNPVLRALMERVTLVVDPSLPDGLEQHAWSRVALRLADGRTLTTGPRGAHGRRDTPLALDPRERNALPAEETCMGALDGIKILELARVPPAELPGMLLADMGADVLKIETPEPGRYMDESWVRRTIHSFTNRNKRSMTLNMKAGDGQAIFRKLAAGADVIVE